VNRVVAGFDVFSGGMKPLATLLRPVTLVLGLLIALGGAAPAAAQTAAEPLGARPSVFTYAGRGFLMGGMLGMSTGYLFARSGGWDDNDWKPLTYGTGVGALAGGVLGLTLGIVDMNKNTPGYGAVILRDTVYGTGFGAVAGGIVGALALISTEEGEHILLGASVGALVGAAAGVVLGVVEGNRALSRAQGYGQKDRKGDDDRPSVTISVAAAPELDGSPLFMPALVGRY
jgi:hypothetical protein